MSYEEVQTFIHNAQEVLRAKRTEAMGKTKEQILTTITRAGFTIEEILGQRVGKRKRPSGLPVQFRNPSNKDETWTGMGRQPNWLKEALAKDGNLEDFRIRS